MKKYETLRVQYETLRFQYETLRFQYETLRVQYETLRVQYKNINLWYETLMVSYWTLKVSYFFTEPFFAVQNLKKGFVRDGSASEYSSEPFEGSVEFFILFSDFGHIWMLLEIHRTFSLGSVIPLFFFESSTEWFQDFLFSLHLSRKKVEKEDNFQKRSWKEEF